MKALTLHQPWASLAALGVKTIETRSWGTDYRGPLAIHAGATWPNLMHLPPLVHTGTLAEQDAHNRQTWLVIDTIVDPTYHGPQPCNPRTGRQRRIPKAAKAPTLFWPHAGPHYRPRATKPEYTHTEVLPLGAVVATCTLADVVPMVALPCRLRDLPPRYLGVGTRNLVLGELTTESIARNGESMEDQRPYGDFAPGRWAWLLTDVQPLPEPVPARGLQRLWNWEP